MDPRRTDGDYARAWREALALARRWGVRDREDVAQEALLRAWRSGRAEPGWLRAVVRNCAVDARSAEARVCLTADADARAGCPARALCESRLDARRELRAVLAGAARLPPSLRAVFDAVVREGRAIEEVARSLGVSRAVVDTRLRRMRARLRARRAA